MLNHYILKALKRLPIIDRAGRAVEAELPQMTSDRGTISVGAGLHEQTAQPGTSRAIARKSSVPSFRYGIVDSSERCPSKSPMTLRGIEARSRLTARACRKICGPRLPRGL